MSDIESDPRVPEILDIVSKETMVERERLTPDAKVEELGIASLDMVQAIFAIESHFGIELPVVSERTGSNEFPTVRDLLTHILTTIDAKTRADGTAGAATQAS